MAYDEKTDWLPDDPINEDDVNRWEKGIKDAHTDLAAHKNDMNNPHNTTKAQVGLGNVDNVQQAAKKDFDEHEQDQVRHITHEERVRWNGAQLSKITKDDGSILINISKSYDFHSVALGQNKTFTFYISSDAKNAPSQSVHGIYLHSSSTAGEAMAMAEDGGFWRKSLVNGIWSDWIKYETEEDSIKRVAAHSDNKDIHVTKGDKDKWDAGQFYKITQDNGKVFYKSSSETTDYNELTATGMYLIYNAGLNGPGLIQCFLLVMSYGNTLVQTAYDASNGLKTFYRIRKNDSITWTSWIDIETTEGAQRKVDAHAKLTDIHVTKTEKEKWNASQLFKITADNGTQKINLTSGSFYDSLKDVGSVSFYGTNAVIDSPSKTSLRGMQLVGQPGIGIGYAVDVEGNAWWFYYNANNTAINWYPIESTAGAQSKVDAHANQTDIHVIKSDKDKWNNAQLYPLTTENGQRIKIDNGKNLFDYPTGLYFGAGVVNHPGDDEAAWYYYDITDVQADLAPPQGLRKIVATRSYDNQTWIGIFHKEGNFLGWKRLITNEDFESVTWQNVTLKNGAATGDRPFQYAKWGNLLLLRGHITANREVVCGTIPSERLPENGAVVNVPVSGTTGYSKLFIHTSGDMKLSGIHSNNNSNVTGYYMDNVIALN
ncbi:pyocin knob domain-containing protein [Bacillus halotolerans]|uniref:pyocin knob domain-containing protein n=1 Tax=Bacillus halotolerans TaxID=260554 RepID=UPI0007C4309E|nr:pyocin knob domain-containing protein [Bacillus halotolerans]